MVEKIKERTTFKFRRKKMNKKKWSPEEKFAIVVDMLSGQKPITQVCKSYGVNEGVAYRWRDEALEAMRDSLSDKRKKRNGNGSNEAEKERLLKIIGQQTVVIDYQKKNSHRSLA